MHIMINDFYLSLNDIFIISELMDYGEGMFFQILYHPNKLECNFFHSPKMDKNIDMLYGHFYFNNEKDLINTRNRITNILTNAAQLNEARKAL